MNLENLMRHALGTAANIFADRGEVMPVCLIEDRDGDVCIVGIADMTDKDMVAAQLRHVMRTIGAVRYAFVTEAWMLDPAHARAMTREQIARAYEAGIAATPGRIECVNVLGEDSETGEHGSAWRQILRPETGKPSLGAIQMHISKEARRVGRFATLLG